MVGCVRTHDCLLHHSNTHYQYKCAMAMIWANSIAISLMQLYQMGQLLPAVPAYEAVVVSPLITPSDTIKAGARAGQ